MRPTSHSGSTTPRLACLMIEEAPTTRRVLSWRFPCLEIEPSLSFPPLEESFGLSPIQAAKSRLLLKPVTSLIVARTVAAISGPTPGMLVRRLAVSSGLTLAKTS